MFYTQLQLPKMIKLIIKLLRYMYTGNFIKKKNNKNTCICNQLQFKFTFFLSNSPQLSFCRPLLAQIEITFKGNKKIICTKFI